MKYLSEIKKDEEFSKKELKRDSIKLESIVAKKGLLQKLNEKKRRITDKLKAQKERITQKLKEKMKKNEKSVVKMTNKITNNFRRKNKTRKNLVKKSNLRKFYM